MIRPDQIPDEVVAVYVDAYYGKDLTRKAAFAAALNAWPDMVEQFFPNSPLRPPGIFLPLPTEKQNG